MVSKLRFPRYAHLLSSGRVAAYDLTHGMLADYLTLPPANAAGQERRLVRAVRSPKQSAWLAFTKVRAVRTVLLLGWAEDGWAGVVCMQSSRIEPHLLIIDLCMLAAGSWPMCMPSRPSPPACLFTLPGKSPFL